MTSPLKHLYVHTVSLEALIPTAASGGRTFGAPRSVRARVQPEQRLVRDAHGREVASGTVVYLWPADTAGVAVTIAVGDRLTLPAGSSPAAPPIISVQPHYGREGTIDHIEVRL